MEEKMRREKEKNRVSSNTLSDTPEEPEGETAPSTKLEENSSMDEDEQSHSIDTAIQQPSAASNDEESINYIANSADYDEEKTERVTMQTLIIAEESDPDPTVNSIHHVNQHSTSVPPPPPPPPPPQPVRPQRPKVEVESEKIEVIEISSDGSSGHLIPGRDS